ncbi:hypothetical protein DLAC_02278 [Tieghemostelium lacteum]|uniref:C2 domain-containing protein n=1 Tax=Tieghemostelium lacteum TaxID=361077 RepID=A0A152A4L0_TIELA|nr:hypothetical protein DLAC_02278 [Tieghemostelium lacteum]|eukprot:KYR01169.1 hypothetical protein DLAC_02278 [Tieghemostelium lacteum]
MNQGQHEDGLLQVENVPDIDLSGIDKLLNKEIKDDDIQLTDADLEDPELLAEFSQLERGGSLPKPPPKEQAKLQPMVTTTTTSSVQQTKTTSITTVNSKKLKMETSDDEDDEIASDEDLDKLLENDDDIEIDDNGNIIPPKKPQPKPLPQPKQPLQPKQPVQQVQVQTQQQQSSPALLQDLEERALVYKKNALYCGQIQHPDGTKYLKSYKLLEKATEELKAGNSIDVSILPPKIPVLVFNQSTSTPAKPSASGLSTSGRPTSTQPVASINKPQQQPKFDILSKESIENQERIQIWEIIEHDYEKKCHTLQTEALRLKDTDKMGALTMMRELKVTRGVLEQIVLNKNANPPVTPPSFHFEEKTKNTEIRFNDIKELEVEFTIGKVELEKAFGNVEVYITGEFPYPEQVQKFQSPGFQTTKEQWNYKTKFAIERKKSFQRVLEKKKLTLVFCSSRMLFLKSVIGKAEIKLLDLLTKCEISERVPILKESSKRETGGFIHVSLRMNRPLLTNEVKTTIEKVLVLDSPIALNPNNSQTQITTTTTTTTVASSSISTSNVTPQPPTTAVPKPQPPTVVKPQPTQPPQPTVAKPQPPQPQPTQTTTPTKPQQPPQQPQPTQTPPNNAEDEDIEDFESIDKIVSNNVMEGMIENLKAQIAAQGPKQELIDQKQALEMKLQILEVQVQAGMLSIEAYTQQINNAIESDKKLAVRLKAKGEVEKALKVMGRVKIMKAELEG